MTSPTFTLDPALAATIRWKRRGSCGNPGCHDPLCRCSLCDLAIGLPEEDAHFPCEGCDTCEDQVPVIMWRGEGKQTEQAQFHNRCFATLIRKA